MAKYWMSVSRYIMQVGDLEPRFVGAAPNAPVVVNLPDGTKIAPNSDLKPFDEGPPDRLAPAHAVTNKPPVMSSAQRDETKPKRLADR